VAASSVFQTAGAISAIGARPHRSAAAAGRADEVIERNWYLLRCMSPELALRGQTTHVRVCRLLEQQQTKTEKWAG